MSDRRLTPTNGRVAHVSLKGAVEAARYVEGEPARVTALVADLLSRPGVRERQLLFGEEFLVLDREGSFVFGRSARDGYVGWLLAAAVGPPVAATHWVAAPATHAYPAASIRAKEVGLLSMGARLTVVAEEEKFLVTDLGWHVPRPHLRALGQWHEDPVAVAEGLLGTPYLWGGNSRSGIDCSGLVQMSCLACGIPCPADSDMQRAVGAPVAEDAPFARGEILCWQGHVAWVADENHMLHANARSMSVAYEGLEEGLDRIAASGTPLLARRRPARP